MRRLKFFGLEGLEDFIKKMFSRGYVVTAMKSWGGDDVIKNSGIDVTVAEDVAYQSLNYEETWVTFQKDDKEQSAKFMLTGDKYCDRVPVADWTFSRDKTKPDVIKEVVDELDELYCDSCGQKLLNKD
jgi:hypothetical protein